MSALPCHEETASPLSGFWTRRGTTEAEDEASAWTRIFRLLDLGCLTDRQFSEWIKHQIDQAFRILAPSPKPDIARTGFVCGIIPLALD
jgi:hypothetical protein